MRGLSALSVVLLCWWAALNYGSTRRGGLEALWAGCGVIAVFWIAGLIMARRLPLPSRAMLTSCILLLVGVLPWGLGWFAPTPVASFTLNHFAKVSARWPECIVWWDPANQVALMGGLALLILVVSDLATERPWRILIATGFLVAGIFVAGVAFAQNIKHVRTIYGEPGRPITTNFAGPFYHHTSAGAYINTVWPVALGLTAWAWQSLSRSYRAAAAGALLLLTLVIFGAHGTHVSRMPQVVGLGALVGLLWLLIHSGSFRRGIVMLNAHRNRALTAGALAIALLVGLVATTGKMHRIVTRWSEVWKPAPVVAAVAPLTESEWPKRMRDDLFIPSSAGSMLLGTRSVAYEAAFAAIAAHPLFGHGPANWMGAASQYSHDPLVRTFFQYLQFTHNDYLQAAVQFGVVSAIGWALLLGGGAISVICIAWRRRQADPLTLAAAVAALAVLLQSLWDFPLQMGAIVLNVAILSGLCWARSGIKDPSLA